MNLQSAVESRFEIEQSDFSFHFSVLDRNTQNTQMKYKSCLSAVRANDLRELKKMREAKYKWPSKKQLALEAAAKTGNLELFEYCCWDFQKEIGWVVLCDNRVEQIAAKYGQLKIIKYIVECLNKVYDLDSMLREVCENGHLECLKYLQPVHEKKWLQNNPNRHVQDYRFCSSTLYMSVAAYNGHIEIIKFLRSCGRELYHIYCAEAVAGGQLECLKYLRENMCDWGLYWMLRETIFDEDDYRSSKSYSYERKVPIEDQRKCILYVYEQTENKNEFWKHIFDVALVRYEPLIKFISFDEQPWRQLLITEFQNNPLQYDIEDKKRELADLCQFTHEVLHQVAHDVVQYCVNCYI